MNNHIVTAEQLIAYSNDIYSLIEIAEECGLKAGFFCYRDKEGHAFDPGATKNDAGMYFYVCYDEQAFSDFQMALDPPPFALHPEVPCDIDDLIEHISPNQDIMHSYYSLVPLNHIDGSNDFFIIQACIRAIHDMRTVKMSYGEQGFRPPEYCARETIDALYGFLEERFNPSLPQHMRKIQDNAMKEFVQQSYRRYKKNKPLKHKLFRPHRVDKDYFFKNQIAVVNASIDGDFLAYLKAHWDECPEFVCYLETLPYINRKDNTHSLDSMLEKFPELKGFADDLIGFKRYRISYPIFQDEVFNKWHLEFLVKYFDLKCVVPISELNQDYDFQTIKISIFDRSNWESLCVANGVKCALNFGEYEPLEDTSTITFIYSTKDEGMVTAIKNRLLREHIECNSTKSLEPLAIPQIEKMNEKRQQEKEKLIEAQRKEMERQRKIDERRIKKGKEPLYEKPVKVERGKNWGSAYDGFE